MGQIRISHYLIIILCFILTAIVICQKDNGQIIIKNKSLQHVVENIDGWKSSERLDLDNKIIYALDLDQYVNNTFFKKNNRVSLYIGYYYSSKKLSAAHSPLVCYPGQGWNILDTKKSRETIGKNKINLISMEITNSGRKELILYWFQINDKTSSGTFLQKVYSLLNKIKHKNDENAFVRVSVSMNGMSRKEAYDIGVDFIQAFYPGFLKFIQESS